MKEQYLHVFKNRNYFKLFIADMVSRFGDSLDAIVMTMIVYAITQSASWSALIFAMNKLPTIFIQPIAGAYVEKKNKKKIMVICDVLRAMLVGTIATLFMFNVITKWHLLVITFLISLVEAFRQPTSMSVIPLILEGDDLEVGLSLNQSISKVVELVGLGLAGFMIALFGNYIVVYIDMLTFIFSALVISTMSIRKIIQGNQESHLFQDFKEGLQVVSRFPTMRILLYLAIFLNAILTPYNALEAPLVQEVLHSSSVMLSIISTSITIGMISGSLIYPSLKKRIKVKSMMLIGAYGTSGAYIGSCLAGNYIHNQILLGIIISVIFFITGFGISLMNMFANIELMRIIPHEYLSRVMALVTSLCVSMMPIISFLLTGLTQFIDTFTIFVVTGVINIVIFRIVFQKRLNQF